MLHEIVLLIKITPVAQSVSGGCRSLHAGDISNENEKCCWSTT